MTCVLVAFLALAPPLSEQQTTLLARIKAAGPHNGYGDYCRAAMLMEGDRAAIGTKANVDKSFALVEKGNAKPVSFPEFPLHTWTLLPEFARLKQLLKLEAPTIESEFDHGSTDRAWKSVEQELILSQKIACKGTTGEIPVLVGITYEHIACESVARHVDNLTPPAAEALSKWADSALRHKPYLRAGIRSDVQEVHGDYQLALADPAMAKREFLPPSDSFTPGMIDAAKKAPASWRKLADREIMDLILAPQTAMIARLSEPESSWLTPVPTPKTDGAAAGVKLGKSVSLGFAFYALKLSAVFQALNAMPEGMPTSVWPAAEQRIRERILRLTCQVALYRFKHGHLPTTLAQAVGMNPTDPATHTHYAYTKSGKTFTIQLNVPGHGTIGLQR